MTSKTQTSTSNQTSTPVNQAALQNIYNTVQGAASTPYTPYSGELTAGINGQQTAGINTINSAANSAQPYYSQAAGLASSASNPLTASQIQQYQNPYTQNVVNATQAQFNDQNGQQQNSLKGTAAQQGALGGDRQAVAQAQLAGQQQLSQAPTIANLYANSYNSGLQTAQQQYQANPLAASSALSGIGTNVENAGLSGGAAQLAAGTQQQQTQQAADTANYGQYQAQQAYPYQNAAFLEQYGLPAALGQGSTSSGTQTSPGPNPLTQALGLGTAAVTAFSDERLKENIEQVGKAFDGQPIYRYNFKGSPKTEIGLIAQEVEGKHPDSVGSSHGFKTVNYGDATDDAAKRGHFALGGRIGFYSGGAPGYVNSQNGYVDSNSGYIPAGQASQNTLQAPQLQFAKPADTSASSAAGKLLGTAGKAFGSSSGTPNYGQSSNIDIGGYSMPQFGNSIGVGDYSMPTIGFHAGGLVSAIHEIHKTIKRSRGGAVDTPFQAYADGGSAEDDPGIAERISRSMNGGRDRGQRAFYNDTRAGLYNSSTAPNEGSTYGGAGLGLNTRRQLQGYQAEDIEKAVRGYADGGDTTFDDRFSAAYDNPLLQQPSPPTPDPEVINPNDPVRLDPGATQAWRDGVDQPNPAVVADSGMPNADGAAPNPMIAPTSLPPQITNPDNTPPPTPPSALGFDSTGQNPSSAGPPQSNPMTAPSDTSGRFGSFNPFGLSDKAREAIISGALGVAASRSPFALSAIGEGGLQGMKTYSQASKAEQEAQDKAVSQANEQQRINLQAKQIAQNAAQFAKTNARADRAQDEKGDMTEYQKAEVERQKRDEALKLKTPVKIGETVSGAPIMALPKLNPKTNEVDLYPIGRDGTISKDPVAPGSSVRPQAPADASASPGGPPGPAQGKPDPTAPVGSPESRNQAYVKQVEQEDPAYAATIKKAANYELDPAKYASMRNDKRQKFINDVIQYDPNYNPQEVGLRYRAQAAFLPGTKNGDTVTAFNTAISHLDTLKQMYGALKNGDVQALNHLKNTFQQQFGYAAPNDVAALSSIIGGEVVKATVGSQNALGDREEVRQSIGRDLSSQQADSVIDKYQALMAGQLKARKYAYEQSTGLHNFDDKFLLPRSKEVLNSIHEGAPEASKTSKPASVIQNGHTYTLQPDGSYK